MDGDLQSTLDTAMRELVARLEADTRLRVELARARREFFAEGASAAVPGRGLVEASERRFYEWYALERESETLGCVPVTVPRFAADEALMGSCVGVFAITAAEAGSAAARDLQDDSMLELTVPATALAAGDLLVGRLFPAGVGQWLPSVAVTVFRPGGSLGTAFTRDRERLEIEGRLQQVELEHLLLRRRDAAGNGVVEDDVPIPLEHLEADLDKLLGETDLSATAISEQLAAADRPGQVIGPLLERIAFDSEIDLDALRRTLLQIWNAQHASTLIATDAEAEADADAGGPGESVGPPGETLGEKMVRLLDEGLHRHRDVDSVFADLERMAGLEPGAANDAENPYDRVADDDTSAGEPLAGTLDPLVQEYLWERSQHDDAAGATLRTWVELLGNAAVPHADLEDVTALDLMRLLMHVYLGSAPADRVAAVRNAFRCVGEFFAWAEQTQDLELAAVLEGCRGGLLDHLDRLATAGSALSRGEVRGGRPAMLEVVDLGSGGFGVCGEDGDNLWVVADDETVALLRVGDIVLGSPDRTQQGCRFAGPVVVLPRDARKLME
ncbi:MAG: hypothetical protein KDC98_00430 [Planctomycetes bacterium]|nr:hypothetical protein [Planctomycetota bacterium]